MVKTNNNVEVIRVDYELHATEYLKTKFPGARITLQGHREVGRHVRDVEVAFANEVYMVEVKGSNLIDPNGKEHSRWQRVKLTKKDYKTDDPADLFLFVFNTSQIGISMNTDCSICSGPCGHIYKLTDGDQVLSLIQSMPGKTKSIAISRLVNLPEATL